MKALNIPRLFSDWSVLTAVVFACSLAHPYCGHAGLWTVTSLADSGPGSLRAAITSAVGGDSIDFAVTGTITNPSGELFINKDLKLVGPGAEKLAISGKGSHRVFEIESSASVSISALTISDGHARDGADCTNSIFASTPGEDGGGIRNQGTLALTNCVIERCRSGKGGRGYPNLIPSMDRPSYSDGAAGGNGGGIYNSGSLIMAGCSLRNDASGNGGTGGWTRSMALGNGANGGNGGAINNVGTALLIGCTVSSNTAGTGGAGAAGGMGSIGAMDGTPGTPGGNGGSGGGIQSSGSLVLISCTIADNAAGSGGAGGAGGTGMNASHLPAGNGSMGADGGAGGSGGAVYSSGSFQATACTIAGNGAGNGGKGGAGGAGGRGFISYPSGLGGNGGNGGIGGSGGAIRCDGASADMQSVLVGKNSAGAAGLAGAGGSSGGYSGSPGFPGLGPDLYGAFNSKGHNFVSRGEDSSGFSDAVGDIVGSGTPLDPLICSLADNGGPAFTIALRQGSPAIDAGDDALIESPLNLINDQRGYSRKSGNHVDIGAYELHRASGKIEVAASRVTSGPGIQLTLTNVPGASLTMLCATNPSQPLVEWSELGSFREIAPGQFQFSETPQADAPPRFYRVRCP